jgi:predicted small metal-binding protein
MSTYLVKFERIGRTHTAPSITVEATGPEEIARQVYRHARKYLASRDVEVTVDLTTGKGSIAVGVQNGGNFTIERQGPSPKIAIDADCPACGYPERAFDPETGLFSCSSLNPEKCDYESREREA